MLDVRPVDVALREREVGLDRRARIAGVADDDAADDREPGAVQRLNRLERRIADRSSPLTLRVLRGRAEEREVLVEDVLDPEEHVVESRLPHPRRERRAVTRD